MTAMRIETESLIRLVVGLFESVGSKSEEARLVADALVTADLEGVASHGVMLIPMYIARINAGSVFTNRQPEIVEDHGGLVTMTAGHGLGQVSAHAAVELAIERARAHGVAVVAVRNAFHFGAASYWARGFARQRMIGFAFSNTRPLMPAVGGAERIVGNNPLSIAFPSASDEPLFIDMATSATAMGKIRLAEAQGRSIPEGWAIDAGGRPTTSASEAIKGMLLPAAGPKGFGLAVAIDLLCGALSGGSVGSAVRPLYTDLDKHYNCSHTFIAIDAARLGGSQAIGESADAFAETIRTSKKAAGTQRLFAPGEIERARRLEAGRGCSLPGEVFDQLDQLARRSNLGMRLTMLDSES
jgi:LDH2 family malate/lactate/ureidoglycolate dehydrogenase